MLQMQELNIKTNNENNLPHQQIKGFIISRSKKLFDKIQHQFMIKFFTT